LVARCRAPFTPRRDPPEKVVSWTREDGLAAIGEAAARRKMREWICRFGFGHTLDYRPRVCWIDDEAANGWAQVALRQFEDAPAEMME
jgi:hypothetical protein